MPTTPLSRASVKTRNSRRKTFIVTPRKDKQRIKVKAKPSTTKTKTTDSMGNQLSLNIHTKKKGQRNHSGFACGGNRGGRCTIHRGPECE